MECPVSLSVLICSLKSRERTLKKLLTELNNQINSVSPAYSVEVLVAPDSGEMTIGRKRNKLVSRARGEYIAFVDDDDMISGNYIPLVMKALEKKPDCVGIIGKITIQGAVAEFRHSIQYQGWYTNGEVFYRTPNHLNPIKRTKAMLVPFSNSNFGEDQRYSQTIRRYLKTECFIDEPIYIYTPAARDERTGKYK